MFQQKEQQRKKWVFNPHFPELVISLLVFSGRTESRVLHEFIFFVSLSIYSESSKSNLSLSLSHVPSCYCDSWIRYMGQRLEEMMDSMKLLESLTLPRQCMWMVLWNWIICRYRICSYCSACNLSVVSGLALPWRRRRKNPEGTSRPADRKGLQVGHCHPSGSLCSGNTAAVQLCVVQDECPASTVNSWEVHMCRFMS